MKNKKALIIAFSMALVLSLAFSSFSCVTFAAMPSAVTASFTETFDEDTLTAFESNNNTNLNYAKGCVTGGKLVQAAGSEKQQLFIQVKGTKYFDFTNYTDYTVSAKIVLGEANTAPSDKIITAGIAARTTTANTGGYEYQICCAKDQTKGYVRLYDRSKQIGIEGIIATKDGELFDIGVEQTMMMSVNGNNIKCYLNGDLVLEHTDETNTYSTGSAAIRLPTITVVSSCDDFTVEHIEVAENKFYDDFNSYSATDTASQKAIAMIKYGWAVRANALAGYLDGSAITIPADCVYDQIGYQTSGAKGALGWNDYSVEADVTFGTGALTDSVFAGVSGRHNAVTGNSPNGYEIEIFIKTDGTSGMRIFARNGGSVLATCDVSIERGVTYNVKAVFQGNTIYAYLDGNLKLTATDSTYPIGFAGIRYIGQKNVGVGIETKIENFVVYYYDEIPATYFEDFSSYTPSLLEDGVTYDKMAIQNNGWGSTTNGNLITYVPYFANGKLTVPTTTIDLNTNNNTYDQSIDYNLALTNKTKLKNLQNYSVSYDVKGSSADTGNSYLYISGRDTDYRNGYFVRVYVGAGTVRDIILNKNVAGRRTKIATYTFASSQRPDATVDFNIKLIFKGNKISVAFNGTPLEMTLEGTTTVVKEVEDDTYSAGTIGIHAFTKSTANKTAFEIDNIEVIDFDNGYKKVTVGDLDGDGNLDAEDIVALKTCIMTADGEGDVNYDGVTDLLDIVRAKKILASL